MDVVSIGKLSQVCATLFRKEMRPKPGLISQTFTSSTTAIESAKIILDQLVHHNYLGKSGKTARIHGYFSRKFRKLQSDFPKLVSDFRGIGSMIAFKYKDGNKQETIKFIKSCYKNGLISFIAGNNPTYVRFLLPIGGINKKHIDEAFKIMGESLK